MLDFINLILLMSSPVAAAEPMDTKKIILREERYEINRNFEEKKKNLAENEQTKIAQKNQEPEPVKVRSTAAGMC